MKKINRTIMTKTFKSYVNEKFTWAIKFITSIVTIGITITFEGFEGAFAVVTSELILTAFWMRKVTHGQNHKKTGRCCVLFQFKHY